jgi:PAS domain-containing protein
MGVTGAVVHTTLLGGSVTTTTVLAGYAWRRRREPGARAFVALMVAFTVFSGLHAAGLLTRDPALRIALEAGQWVGVTAVPVCWMAFALTYTGYDWLATPRTLAALSVVPAVTLGLVVTNPYHGLVFAENVPLEVAGLMLVEQTFGPWFWVFVAYTYLLLGAGSVLLVRLIVASDFLYADQSVLLLVGVAAPWLANALTLLGVTPLDDPALDMTPYAFTVTGLAFGYATFRHRLLALGPATRRLGRQAAVSGLDDGVLILDTARRLVYCNTAGADILDCDRTATLGELVDEVLDPSALAFDTPDGLATLRHDGRIYEVRTSPVESRDGRVTGHTVVLNDVTAREARERKLRRQRDELEALEALNGVVRGVNRALVDATTVEDIEATVADRLSASTLYDAVRVTMTAPRRAEEPRPHVADAPGDADGAGDSPPMAADDAGTVAWLAGSGVDASGADAFSPTDGGRDIEDERGTWAVVPATYGRTAYGALAVRSDREDGIGERELAVLGELGELVGHTVNAVRSRRLLTADAGIELTFGCGDDDRLAALARGADATLELAGVTPLSGTELLVDLSVEGDGDAVDRTVTAAGRATDGGDGDVVEARAAGDGRVEITLAGGSVLFPLVELGARVTSLSAESGRTRVVTEFSSDVDVRGVAERIEATVPGTRLLARHEHERARDLPGGESAPDVTDRQREALEEAYRAGYFEWPRESTAEDVADEMGIASPTFQQHLRTAHRKLLDSYVDEDETR